MKTFDYLGLHRYSLTFCTHRRRHLFITPAVVGLVLKQISRAAIETEFAVVAYCLMPDHLHLLIDGRSDTSDCKRFIARGKQYSAFQVSRTYHYPLWQRYGFEHVLRDDEVLRFVARYIVENPIRAGLARRVEDYRHVGSLEYSPADLLEGVTRGAEPRSD